MIVLGIDPGMAETGYGVIVVEGSRMIGDDVEINISVEAVKVG